MVRRSFLGRLLAALGLGSLTGVTHADPPPQQKPVDMDAFKAQMALQAKQRADEAAKGFPFPLTIVPGQDALATFERLKKAGHGTPVVLGGDESFAQVTDTITMATTPPNGTPEPSPQQIVAKAMAYTTLDDALTRTRAEERERMKLGIQKRLKDLPSEKQASLAVLLAQLDQEDIQTPELGQWPPSDTQLAPPPLFSARNTLTNRWLERVYIATLPTNDATEAPAWLHWGGWNDCPAPEVHVKALREWRDAYGAEVVALCGDVLELRVKRRPKTREQALTLARQIYRYCPDSVDQGTETLAPLAAIFMTSDWWWLWWD